MLSKRIVNLTDSTAFACWDDGDPIVSQTLAYPALIQTATGLKVHDLSSPGAEMDFQLQSGLFCGLRPNASNINAFMRGLGVDILNILGGVNDWYHGVGIARYINSMTAIVNSAISQGYTKISVSTPFIRFYVGEEPVNGIGEKLSEYCAALAPMVASIKSKHPTVDIRFIDTQSWVPNERQYFLIDDAHMPANAHALIAPLFVSAWTGFGWL